MPEQPRREPVRSPAPSSDDTSDSPDIASVLVANRDAFLGFLERRVGRREIAEDILQEAFTRGIEKQGDLRDGEAVLAWFYRALRNATVDHARRRGAGDRALARFAEELATSESATPGPDALRDEACRCVLRVTETLKPEYAEAVRRIELDGISVTDFATEKGLSKSNAAVRVFRAREALRKKLAETCGPCADAGASDPSKAGRGCFACSCSPSAPQAEADVHTHACAKGKHSS